MKWFKLEVHLLLNCFIIIEFLKEMEISEDQMEDLNSRARNFLIKSKTKDMKLINEKRKMVIAEEQMQKQRACMI